MRILIACDSFKGCFGSAEAAGYISTGILKVVPDAEIDVICIADGGEGTALILSEMLGGDPRRTRVCGPLGDPVDAFFSALPGGSAVMDMASASGLTLMPEGKRDVMAASTFGAGQLILAALEHECRRIYIGIGGSATNDGGLGMAAALGVRFYDKHGQKLGGAAQQNSPLRGTAQQNSLLSGKDMIDVAAIDVSDIDHRLASTEISILCDVRNPLCGPNGAARTYGPQKGATPEQVGLLDRGLAHLAEVVKRDIGPDLADVEGIGAAGGLGLSLIAFAGAKILRGIDYVLDTAGFDEKARRSDLIITGEGKMDAQSFYGKAVSGIAKRGMELGVPVIAVCGSIDANGVDMQKLRSVGVCAAEAAVCRPMELGEAIEKGPDYLVQATERIMRAIAIGSRLGEGPRIMIC